MISLSTRALLFGSRRLDLLRRVSGLPNWQASGSDEPFEEERRRPAPEQRRPVDGDRQRPGSLRRTGQYSDFDNGPRSFASSRRGFGRESFGSRSSLNRSGGGFGSGGRYGNEIGSRLRALDWNDESAPITKDFYREHANVSERDLAVVEEWMARNQVTIQGHDVPRPVLAFNETGFPASIVDLLTASFATPTEIQSITWPIAMCGRDVISVAKTGSGKTLAFILPGILHITAQPARKSRAPTVCVMVPTRELVQQVHQVADRYCRIMNLSIACCFGGASRNVQAQTLRRGVDIVVATPGRMLDFLEDGVLNLRQCSYLVLDEADRMLDMGFEPQIRKIVSQIRPDRQTLMFSATWPREIRQLAADFQKDAAFINVGSLELAANHNITQIVEMVEEENKASRLIALLKSFVSQPRSKTLVFVQTKRKAEQLTGRLRRENLPALAIHGDKSQSERDWALNEFRSGNANVLLATDVAARGLDVNDITTVVNFDYPNNAEDYVHRIGRTGRVEKKGVAYSFFTYGDSAKANDLIKVLREANQPVPPQLLAMRSGNGYSGTGANRGFRVGGGQRF